MPSTEDIERAVLNRQAFDAVFGGWSSFHDGLLLALRLEAQGRGAGVRAEADFELAAGYAEGPDGYFRATSLYRVTLAFHDVADVGLDGFWPENEVGELRLLPGSDAGGRPIQVVLEGIAGCGADLTWQCRAVEVVRVDGPRAPAA